MTTVVDTITVCDWIIDGSAPEAIRFRRRGISDGLLEQRSTTITATITDGVHSLSKSYNAGITLDPDEGIPNAVANISLTAAELVPFKMGGFTYYEIYEGSSDPKTLLLKGRITLK